MKSSYTYKKINDLEIKLDVHIPPSATAENPAPVLVWYHGGGLLQGSRERYPNHFDVAVQERGFAFVSVDYRFAPQADFEEILSDVSDSVSYTIEELPGQTGHRIDVKRWFVSGSSAGGWLSLLVGLGVANPKHIPLACTAIYPITNTLAPFWNTLHERAEWEDGPVAHETVKEHLNVNAPVVSSNPSNSTRSKMYAWMVQSASLNELLYGTRKERAGNYTITNLLKEKKKATPPIYIIHGTVDTAVPFSQAVEVVDALKARNAEVQFDIAHDKDHLWDEYDKNEKMDGLYAFIRKYL